MANSMKVDLIKLLRFLWPSSGTPFMKRYAPASLKGCLPLAARFTEATRGLLTENGSLSAHLRQKKDLQNRWRLAMTTRISRQYCEAPTVLQVFFLADRKSTRLNSSPTVISYAVLS